MAFIVPTADDFHKQINRFTDDFHKKIGNRTIIEWGQHLSSINDSAFRVDHAGTLFKLYSLFAYIEFPYMHIMCSRRNKGKINKLIYLDLYCGNGLNRIQIDKKESFICGSALLALLASHSRSRGEGKCYFDSMILVDSNVNNTKLLSQRCKAIVSELGISREISVQDGFYNTSPNILTITGDSTDAVFISKLTSHLKSTWDKNPYIHIMLFIDPDSPERLRMSTLRELLTFPADLLLLLHTGIFAEMINKKRYRPNTVMDMLDINSAEISQLLSKTHKPSYLRKRETIQNCEIKRITSCSNRCDCLIPVSITTNIFCPIILI